MPNDISKKIYIHHDFNKNQIKSVLLENADKNTRPTPVIGQDKGLLYYDIDIDRIMIWNGNTWKYIKYLDDRDLVQDENVQMQNIWQDSRILTTLSKDDADLPNPYVQKETVLLTYEPNSLDYTSENFYDVVLPKIFSDGTFIKDFFQPIVSINGTSIPKYDVDNNEIWRVVEQYIDYEKTRYVIRFFDQRYNESDVYVTYYRYIGARLSVSLIGGDINKQIYYAENGTQNPSNYEIPLFAPTPTKPQIIDVSINGQEIPHTAYFVIGTTASILQIDTDYLGYEIDTATASIIPPDLIYVNSIQ